MVQCSMTIVIQNATALEDKKCLGQEGAKVPGIEVI